MTDRDQAATAPLAGTVGDETVTGPRGAIVDTHSIAAHGERSSAAALAGSARVPDPIARHRIGNGQNIGRRLDPGVVAPTCRLWVSDQSGLLPGAVILFDQTVVGKPDAPLPLDA